jgi:phosphomannomutase
MVRRISPEDARVQAVTYDGDAITLTYWDGRSSPASSDAREGLQRIREDLLVYFNRELGFGDIVGINVTDGVRIYFANRDIAHIRLSGNAPQLRLYAVADTQARTEDIVKEAIREPDGILRRLEAAFGPEFKK